jgi:hypothetical protein
MNRKTLRCLSFLLVLIGAGPATSVYAGLRDNNLIEFSRSSYLNMSQRALLCRPLLRSIRTEKVIITRETEGTLLVTTLLSDSIRSKSTSLAKVLMEESIHRDGGTSSTFTAECPAFSTSTVIKKSFWRLR